MMAGAASAEDVNLHCSNGFDLRINLSNLSDSTVNGESRQMDWVDAKGMPVSQNALSMPTPDALSMPDSGNRATLLLRWRGPAYRSRTAYFLLDLSKGDLDLVAGGREVGELHSRCINLSHKLAV
jgi:hypothetical protein